MRNVKLYRDAYAATKLVGRATTLAGVGLVMMLSSLAAPVRAQEQASLAGVIVSTVTGEPLTGATVSLVGSEIETVTDEGGQFLIENVPAGALRVRFEAEAHMSVVEELQGSVGAFLRVRLSPVEAVLDEIMVLVGRPSGRDGSSELDLARGDGSGLSVLDLLAEQVPGVVVRRGGGNIGSGAFIFIRGAGSLNSDLAPDIYLDGIRIDGRNTDERSSHILDLISAEEVSRVRVFKGAAGGAGLPLGGANGAIVIETRQGREDPGGS